MSQLTNLNVSPYFDDFDKKKNFQKVLFKPSYPIQARELTGLQSIMQNQIENFAKNIFTDGAVVVPGNFIYENDVDCILVNSTFNGLPVSAYYEDLVGKKIRGQDSGVLAEIKYALSSSESTSGNYVFYLNYLENGGDNFQNKIFNDGEALLLQTPFTATGFNISFESGQGILSTITSNSTKKGSLASISEGVFFVRGFFVDVESQTIVLSDSSSNVSLKVGLNITETIVNADEDISLFDNAKGFANYTAPGADRFKLSLTLGIRDLAETNLEDFVVLSEIEAGIPRYFNTVDKNNYNLIRDELAKRTFDESGNYVVKPFVVDIRENLNDRYQTLGLYYEGQVSPSGNTASESLLTYKINPGKAYVNGYDVETTGTKFLDIEKPRTTERTENVSIPFNAGSFFIVDNVFGSATIGLGTNQYIDLMSSRLGSDKSVAAGTTIGQARVYDYVPESAYLDDKSRMFLRLFDIDTYTKLTLSTQTTLSTPAHIKGKTSKAVGYLKESVTNSTEIILYSVEGQFLDNERIVVNGIDDGRLIRAIKDYSIRDVKSVYADSSVGISTFSADIKLETNTAIAPAGSLFDFTGLSGGICTVTTGLNSDFINLLKEDDIISYSSSDGSNIPIYNKVNSVSAGGTFFTISEISSVDGICNGSISTTPFSITNVVRLNPTFNTNSPGLISILDRPHISNIELNSTRIYQRRLFKNVSVQGDSTITIQITDPDLYFAPFDEDDYVITYPDGSIEPIRFDKFALDTTEKEITFAGLLKSSGLADVITTVRNDKPNPKIKTLNKASTLIVDKSSLTSSGIGTTTLNDGLTYSNIYGLRVQDEDISLNVPDAIRVLAIYESSSTSAPNIPKIQLTGFTGPNNNNTDFVVGEVFEGITSGAVGLVVEKISDGSNNKIEFVYLNDTQFAAFEIIESKESNLRAQISNIFIEDKNITNNYYFENGQTSDTYEYSRIVRKQNIDAPTKQIKIVFQNYTISENDPGEFICVNSYPKESYKYDIPYLGTLRTSDIIDIRPRVKPYNISSNKSPFERDSKDLSFSGALSNYNMVPGENIRITYNFYLGRIDKIVLNPDGTFEILKGIPSRSPIAPADKVNGLTLASINLRPYLYDTSDANTKVALHKRYRMQDISLLEDRISRLERYTTLTLSEMKTESLTIKDSETGLDRFKSGFFVDNFTTESFVDFSNPANKCDISNGYCQPISEIRNLDLQLGTQLISGVTDTFNPTADQTFNADLGSPGIQKTGDLITLSYVDVAYTTQLEASNPPINIGPNNFWRGEVVLTPSSDIWFDEISIEIPIVNETITIDEPQSDPPPTETPIKTHPCFVHHCRRHRRCRRRHWKHWCHWHRWRHGCWHHHKHDHNHDDHKHHHHHNHNHGQHHHHHGHHFHHHHTLLGHHIHHWADCYKRHHDDHKHHHRHDDHKHHHHH